MTIRHRTPLRVALGAMLLASTACSDFLSVENPNVVATDAVDPAADATTFALSARQNLAWAAGHQMVYSSYFVWETWPAETLPEANQFGLRAIADVNGPLSSNLWSALSQTLVSGERAAAIVADMPDAATSLNLTQGKFVSGYALVFMGENFCQGVIQGGPALTSRQVLDSAVSRFTQAINIGRAAAGVLTGADRDEANRIVNASLVGRARAHLQAGKKAEALADASAVAPGFRYDLLYLDNPSSRQRLGNRHWQSTFDRASMVVPPAWRVDDPRVPWIGPVGGKKAIDGLTDMYEQGKYRSYDAPVRLASKLEADYIVAEASGDIAAQLALIAARRAANRQPAYTGPTTAAAVLVELMEQRGREFYLEGKRLGDARRNPGSVLHVPAPGTAYFKPGYSAVGDQTCFPLPYLETSNNSNFQ